MPYSIALAAAFFSAGTLHVSPRIGTSASIATVNLILPISVSACTPVANEVEMRREIRKDFIWVIPPTATLRFTFLARVVKAPQRPVMEADQTEHAEEQAVDCDEPGGTR
ncbi:hypothetical protein GCM10007880_16710 [Mesorhizobium amorphae]|nr:hypothetical protein GCM10007880_16710 [Mesorhizobium amorphae]